MRTRCQQVSGDLQRGHRLGPTHRWEVVEKALKWVASGQIIDQVLDRHTRPRKHWRSTQDFRVTPNNGFHGGRRHSGPRPMLTPIQLWCPTRVAPGGGRCNHVAAAGERCRLGGHGGRRYDTGAAHRSAPRFAAWAAGGAYVRNEIMAKPGLGSLCRAQLEEVKMTKLIGSGIVLGVVPMVTFESTWPSGVPRVLPWHPHDVACCGAGEPMAQSPRGKTRNRHDLAG